MFIFIPVSTFASNAEPIKHNMMYEVKFKYIKVHNVPLLLDIVLMVVLCVTEELVKVRGATIY